MQNILRFLFFPDREDVRPIIQQQQGLTGAHEENGHENALILPTHNTNDNPENIPINGNIVQRDINNAIADDSVIIENDFDDTHGNKCAVCDVQATYAWVPCGHLCLCGPCKTTWSTTENKRSCPVCRANLPIFQVDIDISYVIQEPVCILKTRLNTDGKAICVKCSLEATIAWVPCGHLCLCNGCRDLWRNTQGKIFCPVCEKRLPEVNIDQNRQVVQEPIFIYQYE